MGYELTQTDKPEQLSNIEGNKANLTIHSIEETVNLDETIK